MRGAERVVVALGALGETREAAALAQGADAVAPAGEDLVRIGLVADVPDQPVARGVEDPVQGDGQLDDAKAGARWPPVTETASMVSCRNSSASWRRSFSGRRAQVLGRLDLVEQRRLGGWSMRHSTLLRAAASRTLGAGLQRIGCTYPRRTCETEHCGALIAAHKERGSSRPHSCGLKGSVPVGSPAWLKVSFSTLASACFSRRSQCSFRASPRS